MRGIYIVIVNTDCEKICATIPSNYWSKRKREGLQNKPYWIRPKIYYIMPKKKNREIRSCVIFSSVLEIWEANTKCYKKWPKGEDILGSGTEIQGGVKVFTIIVLAFEFLNYAQVLIWWEQAIS